MSTETALLAARDQARDLATARPTARNRAALKKAQAELDAWRQESAQSEHAETVFPGIIKVVNHLTAAGYKISTSTAYDHWKKDGKIKARADGTFTLSEVLRYAADHLQRKDGAIATDNSAQAKTRAEIRRIEADADMRELKYKAAAGEYITRAQVEVDLGERAQHLKGYLDAVARASAGKIIKLVKGDPQLAPELIALLLGVNKKALDTYSRPIQGLEEEED